jgi:hypothetical protein
MNFEYVNARLNQLQWINHQRNLLQQIFPAIALIVVFYILVKELFLMSRNNIPRFCLSVVVVVERIKK